MSTNDEVAGDSESDSSLWQPRPQSLACAIAECLFVLAIVMSMMMSEYFISGFNLVLPSMEQALNIPSSLRAWPSVVINLTTAAFLLPCARLCDQYGCRRVFLFGHLWLFIWSIACGFSKNTNMLIVCRAMQGCGSAAFLPASIAILGQSYKPGTQKNVVFTAYGAFGCIGFCLGLFSGALAVKYIDWRWYFWIGAVIGSIICVLGFFSIPQSLNEVTPGTRMDWWGFCTIVPGLVLFWGAFMNARHAAKGWASPQIYLTFVLGILFLLGALYVQGWVSVQPLLPPELFRVQYMKRLIAILFCVYGVFGLFLYYATVHIETVMQVSLVLTAVWFTPLAGGGICLAIICGFVLSHMSGKLLLIISCLGFIFSMILFILVLDYSLRDGSTAFTYWVYIFPAMISSTVGVDIAFNVSNVYITTSTPKRLQATAGGLMTSLLCLGIAFWLGISEIAVSIIAERHDQLGLPEVGQCRVAFWMGGALSVIALLLATSVKIGKASVET